MWRPVIAVVSRRIGVIFNDEGRVFATRRITVHRAIETIGHLSVSSVSGLITVRVYLILM